MRSILSRLLFGFTVLYLTTLFTSFSVMSDATKSVTHSPLPSWISLTRDTQPIDNATASSTNLVYEQFLDFTGASRNATVHRTIQLHNTEAVQKESKIELSFYPSYQTMHVHFINVVRDGKTIEKLDLANAKYFQKETQLENSIYDEQWVSMHILEDIRVGDTLDFAYTYEGTNPLFGNRVFSRNQLNYAVPIKHLNYVNKIPKSKNVFHRSTITSVKAVETTVEDAKLISITRHNVQPKTWEDHIPNDILVYDEYELSEYETWEDVTTWALSLYKDKYVLSDDLKNKVAEWKKTQKTPEALAEKIIQYVQEDIRYWGIETYVNSFLPRLPAETAARGYGDCKDKSVLMTALLREAGFKAYPALVSAETGEQITQNLPSLTVFDHVITTFMIGETQYWIDGTNNQQARQLEHIQLPAFKAALIVRPDQKSLSAINTSIESQNHTTLNVEHMFTIDTQKNLTNYTFHAIYSGKAAENLRNYIATEEMQYIENNWLQYYSRYYSNMTLLAPSKIHDNREQNTIEVTSYYQIPNLGETKTARLEFYFYLIDIKEYLFLPQSRERTYPYALTYPLTIDTSIKVATVDDTPLLWHSDSNYTDEQPYFTITKSTKDTEQFTVRNMVVTTNADRVPTQDFRTFENTLDDALNYAGFSVWVKSDINVHTSTKKRINSLINKLRNKQPSSTNGQE